VKLWKGSELVTELNVLFVYFVAGPSLRSYARFGDDRAFWTFHIAVDIVAIDVRVSHVHSVGTPVSQVDGPIDKVMFIVRFQLF
jgi:hypothetical protein